MLGEDGEEVGGGVFRVVALGQVDVYRYLLKRADPFSLVERVELNWPKEPSRRSGDENDRVNSVLEVPLLHECDLRLLWNRNSFYFQVLQGVEEGLAVLALNVARMASIDHDGVAV